MKLCYFLEVVNFSAVLVCSSVCCSVTLQKIRVIGHYRRTSFRQILRKFRIWEFYIANIFFIFIRLVAHIRINAGTPTVRT